MPPHYEYHFSSNKFVSDIVIGILDDLAITFALAAGLAGSVASTLINIDPQYYSDYVNWTDIDFGFHHV